MPVFDLDRPMNHDEPPTLPVADARRDARDRPQRQVRPSRGDRHQWVGDQDLRLKRAGKPGKVFVAHPSRLRLGYRISVPTGIVSASKRMTDPDQTDEDRRRCTRNAEPAQSPGAGARAPARSCSRAHGYPTENTKKFPSPHVCPQSLEQGIVAAPIFPVKTGRYLSTSPPMLHGLIERFPKSFRHRVTEFGFRTALFLTRLYHLLLRPPAWPPHFLASTPSAIRSSTPSTGRAGKPKIA